MIPEVKSERLYAMTLAALLALLAPTRTLNAGIGDWLSCPTEAHEILISTKERLEAELKSSLSKTELATLSLLKKPECGVGNPVYGTSIQLEANARIQLSSSLGKPQWLRIVEFGRREPKNGPTETFQRVLLTFESSPPILLDPQLTRLDGETLRAFPIQNCDVHPPTQLFDWVLTPRDQALCLTGRAGGVIEGSIEKCGGASKFKVTSPLKMRSGLLDCYRAMEAAYRHLRAHAKPEGWTFFRNETELWKRAEERYLFIEDANNVYYGFEFKLFAAGKTHVYRVRIDAKDVRVRSKEVISRTVGSADTPTPPPPTEDVIKRYSF